MDIKQTSIEKVISDISQVLRIQELTPFAKDSIKDILLNLERNGKWDGVINHNNWVAGTDSDKQVRTLTVNKNRKL